MLHYNMDNLLRSKKLILHLPYFILYANNVQSQESECSCIRSQIFYIVVRYISGTTVIRYDHSQPSGKPKYNSWKESTPKVLCELELGVLVLHQRACVS